MTFSERSAIQSSETTRINDLAQAKRRLGERVYNLSVGEPLVTLDAAIIEAADVAMRQGKTRYPPVPGIPELRTASTAWVNRMYSTAYTPEESLITTGGKFAVFALLAALVNPHDEVIVIAPYWVSYPPMVQFFGGTARVIQTKESDRWKVTVAMLESARTDKTNVLIFNNGANPTGVIYTKEEIRAILAWAKEYGVFVISDEVYSGLVYVGEYVSCGSFPEYKESIALVQSASKNFAMTGFRVGFVFGPKALVDACAKIQGQSTTGTSIISQYAVVAACNNAERVIATIHGEMEKRRKVLCDALVGTLPNFFSPPSALYAFVSLNDLGVQIGSTQFCEKLLEKHNVAAVPGVAFGMEGYVRLSFGGGEGDIEEGARMLCSC